MSGSSAHGHATISPGNTGEQPDDGLETLAGQYLLQGAAEPLPVRLPAGIRLPGGAAIHAAAAYYLVAPTGAVIRTYPAPRAFSLEDTLYITDLHAVVDRRLIQFLWQHHAWRAAEVAATGVMLAGLAACPSGELPFDAAAVIAGGAAS